MKLQRFFVTTPIISSNPSFDIPSPLLVNQLKNVLRMDLGSQIQVFDNSGYQYMCAIDSYHKDSVSLTILEKQENTVKPDREIWLFAALVKKDTFEWIVEKATELGVSHIVPVISARTEKKDVNMERLTKISIEAAEQSGRGTVPKIHNILKLADCLDTYSEQKAVVWEPTAQKFDRKDMNTIVSTYIGPEGGWTKEELEMFEKKGMKLVSLGPQILRAETAVVAALAQMVF
jgi:16S rRNA (uracil1498-N3)-methyltransferase